MNKAIISAVALLTLVACGQQQEGVVVDEPKTLVSGIDTSGMDTSVRPGEDFFTYMNGTWVEKTEIPADKPRYGTFDLL
ncbi:MAG: M13 family peptidase, partial [Gammaproteobacteria bacterium]|nr:M13 family peptidase [Gammaproteobacteria bacterium]